MLIALDNQRTLALGLDLELAKGIFYQSLQESLIQNIVFYLEFKHIWSKALLQVQDAK